MKQMSYLPQPAKEVLIPKADGNSRRLGIACIEDKIIQSMTAKVLEAIYEPLFRECSYGFRPNSN
jgi:retron-type reverse transcriptase